MNTLGAPATHLQNQLRVPAVERVQVTDGRLATKFQWHARQGNLQIQEPGGTRARRYRHVGYSRRLASDGAGSGYVGHKEVKRTMNKKDVEQLSNAVTALRASGFETLSEAAVFCAAATATAKGKLSGITEISLVAKLPISTVSRLIWELSQRGLIEYTTDAKDRRMKRVRAKLEAFK